MVHGVWAAIVPGGGGSEMVWDAGNGIFLLLVIGNDGSGRRWSGGEGLGRELNMRTSVLIVRYLSGNCEARKW